MAKKSFNKGTIEKYRSTLSKCIANKETFTTYSSGMSRRIILPTGVNMKFFGTEAANSRISGAFMVQMVQREIDAYIEANGIPTYNYVSDVQLFNLPKIKEAMNGKKKPVVGIDINACYWNTAHKLGYISDALFERGLDTCKKQGLLIAIGCLNKKPVLKSYKEGKLIGYSFDEQIHSRYAPFYWNIIEHTHQIMIESYERFKDNWYMYLTDCLFVDLEVAKDAHKFIIDKGYKCKSHQIEFINFDGKRLRWFDFKDNREKEIHAQGRDIDMTYSLTKIGKGMHDTPPFL
jgi:hypothetical protein